MLFRSAHNECHEFILLARHPQELDRYATVGNRQFVVVCFPATRTERSPFRVLHGECRIKPTEHYIYTGLGLSLNQVWVSDKYAIQFLGRCSLIQIPNKCAIELFSICFSISIPSPTMQPFWMCLLIEIRKRACDLHVMDALCHRITNICK